MPDQYLSVDGHEHEHTHEQDQSQSHARPTTLHAHEHEAPRAGGSGSISPSNRLSDFASHILDSRGPHPHVLSFTGEGGVLESSEHHAFDVEDAVRRAMEDHDHGHDRGLEHDHDQGEFQPHVEVDLAGENPAGDVGAVRRSTVGRGRKRRMVDVGEDGEPLDPAFVKRENHKEVERKRRTNINEGIDQLVAQMNLPELEKAGKGVQLRRAVEFMADLGERVTGCEREVEDLRKEKQDLEANLALTSQRYTEEHERCTRYETMWRDAQDREAKSQFDIAQLLDEMAQLRRRLGDVEG